MLLLNVAHEIAAADIPRGAVGIWAAERLADLARLGRGDHSSYFRVVTMLDEGVDLQVASTAISAAARGKGTDKELWLVRSLSGGRHGAASLVRGRVDHMRRIGLRYLHRIGRRFRLCLVATSLGVR